jgi:hypothetical protein
MSDDLVIVPSNGDGYVELARSKQGRLFRKHILNKGDLIHPKTKEKIKVDDEFVNTLKTNFANNVCDIVQVPLANDKNEHTEDPTRNIGEVIGIEDSGDKVYVVIDARDSNAEKLGKTLLGASAMMHLDYTDTKTGEKVGPTLLHACVTNRPYVTGLENYEEITKETVAATSDNNNEAVVLLTDDASGDVNKPPTEEKTVMPENETQDTAVKPSLEELLSTLKTDHNIDVPALQAKATESNEAAKLSRALTEALGNAGLVTLSNDTETVSNDDVVGAVAQVAQDNVALTNRLTALERERAEDAVQADIAKGLIKPAKKTQMVDLKLSNPSLYDAVLPDEPIVKLNHEQGKNEPDAAQHTADITKDIERLVELANQK